MYLNDLETELATKGLAGIDIGLIDIYLIMYADDIILLGKTPDELQEALTILEDYCNKWKLTVNTEKTKIMVFRKGGRLREDLNFIYNNSHIEIVNKLCYLGVFCTAGISNFETQKTLASQASKAIFTLTKFLYSCTTLKPSHRLKLFDKLVYHILLAILPAITKNLYM